jgi:hypothetical protein
VPNNPNGAACGSQTIFCTNRLAGFNGNSCHVYTADRMVTNQCGLTGLCAATNDYHLCTGAASVSAHTPQTPCGEAACRNIAACPVGASQTTIAYSTACDESGSQNQCASGLVCRTGSTCQVPLLLNGAACSNGPQCSSGFCSVDG